MKREISIGAITELSTKGNKTGSWRTFKPLVNERCNACKRCVILCPEGCMEIKEVNGKMIASVDYDYCKGCMICENVCPIKAIIKEEEVK